MQKNSGDSFAEKMYQSMSDDELQNTLRCGTFSVGALNEEQIELIFEMIGEILKKAVQHVLNTKSQTEEKEVFSTETRPDQLLLAQMENGYLTNLLKNASECYIRFATKCKETDGKKETEKAICEKIAGALNGAEKYTKTFAKAVNSEIDRWVLLLAEQVKEERRKNR